MKLSRTLAVLAALIVVPGSLVACGGSALAPQSSASAATKAPVGTTTHGFVKIIGDALGEVPLRPEQRTELEKLAAEADARRRAMAEGRKELMAQIADQIEAGASDRAALQPKIDRIARDTEKIRREDEAALARVHALLDAEQRNALADALEARFHHGAGHAHEGKGKGKGKGRGKAHAFGHMKQLADDLSLTDEQRTQIRGVLMESRKEGRDRGEHRRGGRGKHGWKGGAKRGKHALEAFRSDDFDASAIGARGARADKAADGATKVLSFAEKILPILTPEQRKIAADKLRAMSSSGKMPFAH